MTKRVCYRHQTNIRHCSIFSLIANTIIVCAEVWASLCVKCFCLCCVDILRFLEIELHSGFCCVHSVFEECGQRVQTWARQQTQAQTWGVCVSVATATLKDGNNGNVGEGCVWVRIYLSGFRSDQSSSVPLWPLSFYFVHCRQTKKTHYTDLKSGYSLMLYALYWWATKAHCFFYTGWPCVLI